MKCVSCDTCAPGPLGAGADKADYVVALAGNPNVGKSTVFNALTGLRQHTGNWPGKTVTRAEGLFSHPGKNYRLVDLPGTYSLLARSTDEEVARDFILFGRPDVTLVVVDATRLERNLNLVLQVLEITERVVVCSNLMDEARRHGIKVDVAQLAKDLGVPVIGTAARQGEGLPELVAAVADVAHGRIGCRPFRGASEPPQYRAAIQKMTDAVQAAFPKLPNARWVALRILDGDDRVLQAVRSGELGQLEETVA